MASLYLRYELFQAVAQFALILMALVIRFSSQQFVKTYTDALSDVIHSLEQLHPNQELLSHDLQRATAVEFKELQTSFIKMQRRISQAHRQIQQVLQEKTQLSNELEQRVQLRTQELSLERDKANELASIKTRFLANMSHELRTPLTIIQGYAEQMTLQALSPAATAQLQAIQEHSKFLLHIVNDILDTAKIDEGKLRLDPQAVDLHNLLLDVANSLRLLTAQKNLLTDIVFASDLPQHIITDSFRLRQILMNLISNAVKFTEKGFVRFLVTYQANELKIEIVDSGPGISEEQQQRMFQAFEQADPSTTRQFGGTGLGLYICQRLAQLLDARLLLQSTLGQGSCFTLILPVTLSQHFEPTQQETAQVKYPDLTGKTLLIVDDVSELRRLFASMLAGTNATIVQASHGDEALEILLHQSIQLMLLDMHMPVRDGMNTLKTLRQLGYELPVIALTADVLPQKHQEIMEVGGQLVLTKPVSQANLLQAVQLTLKSSTQETPQEFAIQQTAAQLKTQDTQLTPLGVPTEVSNSADAAWDELQLSFIDGLSQQNQILQAADREQLQLLLHKLKGTSACLDFKELSELASVVESQLKQQTDYRPDLDRLIEHIAHLLAQRGR